MTLPDPTERARAIRGAVLQPHLYLAAALAEWTDEAIAEVTGALPERVILLRLSHYPHSEHWQQDLDRIAAVIEANPRRLEAFLGERGVRP